MLSGDSVYGFSPFRRESQPIGTPIASWHEWTTLHLGNHYHGLGRIIDHMLFPDIAKSASVFPSTIRLVADATSRMMC